MLSPLTFALFAFALGLLFGSFLNVCISRLPHHRSIVKPPSHCPQCRANIRWYDNLPLLSWLALRACCRNCKMPISWRYPAVELITGIWFAWAWLMTWVNAGNQHNGQVGPWMWSRIDAQYFYGVDVLILGFLLIGLLVMDWQTHTLPDAFTLTGSLIGFVLTFVQAMFLAPGEGDIHFDPRHNLRLSSPGSFVAKGDVFMTGPEHLVLGRLLAMVCAAGLLLLVRYAYKKLRHREGLGLGDAKLLAMIAAFLGFWPAMLALFVGVVLCSLFAVTLLATRRATAATRLPLGTFLCIGGLISALIGTPLIAWYQSLL